ncbi:MAG: hypothetical protein FJ034_06220 [Chloroflexi bacterium]|nr:hypothetical protein [Chloroflexota bacterium]
MTRSNATVEPLVAGNYRVWFTWVLEGVAAGDAALVRAFAGTQPVGEQRVQLNATTFNPATNTFTISLTSPCSPSGWSAEIVSIRETRPDGDPTARATGSCR